jgi:hypothetical protein
MLNIFEIINAKIPKFVNIYTISVVSWTDKKHRVTHRLDKAEYAVKKVYAKFSKERVLVKILREVTLLAKVRPHTVLDGV